METRLQRKTAGIILYVCLSVLLSGCGNRNPESPGVRKSWKIESVSRQDVWTYRDYPAAIRGCQDVEIRPQVSGLVTQVCVTEGQRVHRGGIVCYRQGIVRG